MTVVRVYGTINGRDLLPFRREGDRFYFPAPETLTGKYVCEFWAEDDFGNVGYAAALLTLEKGVIKCVEVLTKDYKVTMRGDPVRVSMADDPYSVRILPITCRRDMMEVMP